VLRYVGRVDDSEKIDRVKSQDARNAIEALLAGTPVPVETTRTFGCSIKWSDKRDSVKQALKAWAKEEVTIEPVDLNGVKELVKNNSDKLRLMNVWASWCGPCAIEFGDLVNVNRMYRNRNFEMVTISVDDGKTRNNALSFLKKQQASCKNYQYSSEDKEQFADTLDRQWPGGIPYTILVKPGGEIIYRHLGIINPLGLKKAIVEYLGRTYK
jgi:thiol-disulfide isomerase/thioredoxin